MGAFLAVALGASTMTGVAHAAQGPDSQDAEARVGIGARLGGFFGRMEDRFERRHGGQEDRDEKHGTSTVSRPDHKGLGNAIVTGVSGSVLTATDTRDGSTVTWTITTDAVTRFVTQHSTTTATIGAIAVGDRVAVAGTVTDNEGSDRAITARIVVRKDASKAHAGGTVQSVSSDGTVVITTQHQGDVKAVVGSDTVIKKDGATGALSDIVVGTKIHVRGMWDSVKQAIIAAKVRVLG